MDCFFNQRQQYSPLVAVMSCKKKKKLIVFKGPAFWGLINPEWWLCNKGRRQSPVNLEPTRLLFDPNLQPLHLDKHRINGVLANTGHSVVFAVENDTRHPVNISGGPLSYRYQFHEIHLHFGADDRIGSEHTVDGHAFPAEVKKTIEKDNNLNKTFIEISPIFLAISPFITLKFYNN